ncbi:glycosyltransferase [Marinitoga sp. 38H-ov]|uniref:glycosyltransferase family 32 protein n=1 Tax=Marinitoga sp. 38H-ov TaxID=1755814 RepID=UPI0013EADECF|nr:glycosyltransferase [Marinitoga sp. 38H-ov]KAF2955580.1 glycosyl transferase [Marinitoga sp. 38H-ov]
MIPKKIHYCWFGKGKKPEIARKCIESWKIHLPDYEIIEWNEDNFDINENIYIKEAYENKKYAFVTDYVRLKVLYEYGGIYMDTDVEVIKNLDKFLHHNAFSGYENDKLIPTGIMGATPKNSWIKLLLDYYNDKKFVLDDGTFDLTTNVIIITELSKKMGYIGGGKYQEFGDGIAIYPFDYFCAKNDHTGEIHITDNTHTIHHFSGTWQPLPNKIRKKIRKIIGNKAYNFIRDLLRGELNDKKNNKDNT